MKINRLSADFTVGTQLEIGKIPKIARHGFATIVCNRPDGEAPDQLPFAEIEAEARRHGLEAHYLPIALNDPGDDLARCVAAIDGLPRPIFAYCRSGTRSATMLRKYQMG